MKKLQRAPRCVAAVPNLKRIHDAARAHNMVVGTAWSDRTARRRPTTSWTPPSSRAPANGIARAADSSSAHAAGNLKASGIKTVIVCGNSFQGATVGTWPRRSGATRSSFGRLLAGEDAYHEQYAAFHLAKGGPAGVTSNVTMTRTTMIVLSLGNFVEPQLFPRAAALRAAPGRQGRVESASAKASSRRS